MITSFIGIAILIATNFNWKFTEKFAKYCDLADQLKELYGERQVRVIPVLGVMRDIPRSEKYLTINNITRYIHQYNTTIEKGSSLS